MLMMQAMMMLVVVVSKLHSVPSAAWGAKKLWMIINMF